MDVRKNLSSLDQNQIMQYCKSIDDYDYLTFIMGSKEFQKSLRIFFSAVYETWCTSANEKLTRGLACWTKKLVDNDSSFAEQVCLVDFYHAYLIASEGSGPQYKANQGVADAIKSYVIKNMSSLSAILNRDNYHIPYKNDIIQKFGISDSRYKFARKIEQTFNLKELSCEIKGTLISFKPELNVNDMHKYIDSLKQSGVDVEFKQKMGAFNGQRFYYINLLTPIDQALKILDEYPGHKKHVTYGSG